LATYSLYDYPAVAAALYKSFTAYAVHQVSPENEDRVLYTHVIESARLLAALEEAAQELTQALFRDQQGRRTVPVYIFSLLGFQKDLLLDRRFLHVSTPSAVLVLQTGTNRAHSPYYTKENHPLPIDCRDVTREVVAGLAEAVFGVMPPYERYSHHSASDDEGAGSGGGDVGGKMVRRDFLFSTGVSPFGPFSDTYRVSEVQSEIARRNLVLQRISVARKLLHGLHDRIHAFRREFSVMHVGDFDVNFEGGTAYSTDLIGARLAVHSAQKQTDDLQRSFDSVGAVLASGGWEQASREALSLVATVDAVTQQLVENINTYHLLTSHHTRTPLTSHHITYLHHPLTPPTTIVHPLPPPGALTPISPAHSHQLERRPEPPLQALLQHAYRPQQAATLPGGVARVVGIHAHRCVRLLCGGLIMHHLCLVGTEAAGFH
jgi:hypothetical protein